MRGTPVLEPDGPAGAVCPICGGCGVELGRTNRIHSAQAGLRHCCGVLLSWQWNSEEEYEQLYTSGGYHEATQQAEGQATTAERDGEHFAAANIRLDHLSTLYPVEQFRSLTDVGCGCGAFVEAAASRGYAANGIDPDPEIVSYALRRGRRVRIGAWQDVDTASDIITLFDVFEHLTRPAECLAFLGGLLTPGGGLVIEMPELDCPNQAGLGAAWRHWRPMQHVCLYSLDAALVLFRRAGFEIEDLHRPLRGSLGKVAIALRHA